jgi:hypothetical protein
MSNLKRKDAPGGNPPAKSAKNTKEARPTTKEKVGKDAKPAPKKSADEPEKAPVVSILKEDEPMFPRGGASVLTPLEQKKINIEAKADAMRDEEFNTASKDQKKKKRKSALKGDKKADKKTGEEEQTIRVESLSFKVSTLKGINFALVADFGLEIGQGLSCPCAGHTNQQPRRRSRITKQSYWSHLNRCHLSTIDRASRERDRRQGQRR